MSRRRWAAGLAGVMVVAGSTTLVSTGPTTAATTPDPGKQVRSALGNGLGRLAEPTVGMQRKGLAPTGVRIDPDALTVRDRQGRVMVQLAPQQGVNRATFRKQAEAQGLVVKGADPATGMLEGFIPLSSVGALAGLKGTGTVAQSVRPETRIGKATSQGVVQQRVDKVLAKGVNGKGITVGVLSDSFDTATTNLQDGGPLKVHYAQDVKSGDLPGKGNKKYPTPVVNLEDYDDPGATDEGRGMAQIIHDVAPGAKLCFASAFVSELRFAENIRRLADKKGKCKADIIVDDVGYFDEPMFSDGILSDAIDDVAAQGVHYFTSAGNDGEDNSWNSDVRLIPAKKGVKGTNLDFSEVDPALYDGGLQDMDPGSGTDVAQDVRVGEGSALLNVQWNDPVDIDGATYGDPPLFSASGTLTEAQPSRTYTWNAPASQVGKQVEFRTDGVPSGSTDLVLQVSDPNGNNLGEIDTGSSPEVLAATVSKAGAYKITISGFDDATGPFTVLVRNVLAPSRVSTDFNVLLFDSEGAFLGAVSDINPLSGRPQELAALDGIGDIQLVISRSGTGKVGATKLRNVLSGDLYFTEYSDPLSPAHTGHTMAAGASSVAAYDPFKSYLPEPYTSPGGRLPIYFDSSGDRYKSPQIRQVPAMASSDRGNTTFFAADDLRDSDKLPNFGGTSASAPHAAAIAALVLQKAGGPKALSPTALRKRLQASAFKHDLDPMSSGGSVKGLTVTARGNQGRENSGTTPGSINDPNFFRVSYSGSGSVKSLTFYGETASPTAPGKKGKSDGIVFDKRPYTGLSPWADQGFPFTVGSLSGGLSKSSVTPTFSVPGGGNAGPGQYRRLTVNFKNGLKSGQGVRFGVDRDLATSPYGGSNEGNGADELGGSIFLPQGTGSERGMVFVATLSNGKKITGVFTNKLGNGWTPIDGFGLVNAEKAVLGR